MTREQADCVEHGFCRRFVYTGAVTCCGSPHSYISVAIPSPKRYASLLFIALDVG